MAQILSSISVSEVMTSRVVTLGMDTSLAEARDICVQFGNFLYPVMDEQQMIGIVTYEAILEGLKSQPEDTPVKNIPMTQAPAIGMDRSLKDAARLMAREDNGRLIVVDQDESNHLIGIVSRSDVLKAYSRELAEREEA